MRIGRNRAEQRVNTQIASDYVGSQFADPANVQIGKRLLAEMDAIPVCPRGAGANRVKPLEDSEILVATVPFLDRSSG